MIMPIVAAKTTPTREYVSFGVFTSAKDAADKMIRFRYTEDSTTLTKKLLYILMDSQAFAITTMAEKVRIMARRLLEVPPRELKEKTM